MGGYEPNPKPWAERGLPERFEFQLLDEDWDHFEPIMELALGRVPALRHGRRQAADQRPGELHPRRQLDHRRGAGDPRRLRRRRLQRLRHRLGRRGRDGAGRVGGQGRAALRRLAGRHPPLRPQPPGHGLGPHPHARGLRQALRHGLAARGVPLRPTAAPLAALAAAQGSGCVLRREAGLGAAQLVRRARRGAGRQPELRPPELVRGRRPRAPGLPRARGPVRPDLVREVPHGRPRRRGRALLAVRQRRGQAAGQPDLHPAAQRQGRHRVRPHRRPPRARPLLPRHRHRLRHPRFRLDHPPHPGGPRRRT